ncbi:hypothetical protein AB0C34_15485 [Nocardia sp. NPDC049220]
MFRLVDVVAPPERLRRREVGRHRLLFGDRYASTILEADTDV